MKRPYVEPHVHQAPHLRRNGPCPCGSGKKFKRCCRPAILALSAPPPLPPPPDPNEPQIELPAFVPG